MRLSSYRFRLTVLGAALVALAPLFGGCDTTTTGPVYADTGVRSATFTLGDRNNQNNFFFSRDFSNSGDEVQFEARNFPGVTSLLTAEVVDGGIVMLYASDVANEDGLVRSGWTALPLTLGYDEPTDTHPEGDGFIDYVITTTYTFDVQRLYVNLIASDVYTIDFLDESTGFLDAFEDVVFRLVTIPAAAVTTAAVDYSDYEAVKNAFGLED